MRSSVAVFPDPALSSPEDTIRGQTPSSTGALPGRRATTERGSRSGSEIVASMSAFILSSAGVSPTWSCGTATAEACTEPAVGTESLAGVWTPFSNASAVGGTASEDPGNSASEPDLLVSRNTAWLPCRKLWRTMRTMYCDATTHRRRSS